jgi:membrane protein implicated in regulation of membrane protease activity
MRPKEEVVTAKTLKKQGAILFFIIAAVLAFFALLMFLIPSAGAIINVWPYVGFAFLCISGIVAFVGLEQWVDSDSKRKSKNKKKSVARKVPRRRAAGVGLIKPKGDGRDERP